jgi:hypothetical protein
MDKKVTVDQVSCLVCEKTFNSEKSLHAHVKAHKINLAEYYTTFYPRKSLLTGEPLPFKDKGHYFCSYFRDMVELEEWCETAPLEKTQEILLKLLSNRIKDKNLQYAPNHLELQLNDLPSLNLYKKFFKSYGEACRRLEVEPLFSKKLNKQFFLPDQKLESLKILIDTREQKPLKIQNSSLHKLDFGDYTASGEHYNNTYIDRKSETDFKSTLSMGLSRFKKELQRARDFDSFLYVLVESSIAEIIKNNSFSPHKSNLSFVWHNMRELTHEFARTCQFIFSGGRKQSEKIIPILLLAGPELWNSDIQYYIDNGEVSL